MREGLDVTEDESVATLEVDRVRCEGYGFCEQTAPEVIHLDEDDEPVVDVEEITRALRALADAAVRACPVAALRLTEKTRR